MARDSCAIEIAPRARRYIQEIWAYIVADDPAAADRVTAAIDAAIRRIGRYPEHATYREFYGARMLPVLSYSKLFGNRDVCRICRISIASSCRR